MEPVIWMSMGAAGVVCLILMRLAAKHGWAWVQGRVKQHAGAIEADFKAKVAAAVGDLDGRIRDVVHSELAKVESDIATLKTKVGV
jgi:hypothetical protein